MSNNTHLNLVTDAVTASPVTLVEKIDCAFRAVGVVLIGAASTFTMVYGLVIM